MARHHGIPTRFLDWTRDPSIAAYFSAVNDDEKGNDNICVWALNTQYIMNVLEKGRIKLHDKLHHVGLEFLHKQKGLFTEMIGAEGYYFFNGEWPSLDKYLKASDKGSLLKQIVLPRKYARDVIDILNTMDINKYHLMPTYDNVANAIK